MSTEKEEEEADEVESRTTPSSSIVEDCSTVCFVDFLLDFIQAFLCFVSTFTFVCLSLSLRPLYVSPSVSTQHI